MSEYEYDKDKPEVSGQQGTPPTNPASAPSSPAPSQDENWQEQDEWSLRSTSIDEDDPLLKLARLMQQNERDMVSPATAETSAEMPPSTIPPVEVPGVQNVPTPSVDNVAGDFPQSAPTPDAPSSTPNIPASDPNQAFMRPHVTSTDSLGGPGQADATFAENQVPQSAPMAPVAPQFEEDEEWYDPSVPATPAAIDPQPAFEGGSAAIPEAISDVPPAVPAVPSVLGEQNNVVVQDPNLTVAEAIQAKQAQEAAQRAEELRLAEEARMAAEQVQYEAEVAERARLDAENARRLAEEQAQRAAMEASAPAPVISADPFATPPTPQASPVASPAMSSTPGSDMGDFDVSRMPRAIRPPEAPDAEFGGLHGRASDDILAAATAPQSASEPAFANQTDMVDIVAPGTFAQDVASSSPDQPSGPADAVVPASALTPTAPDYSYLRDVDDLRAPAREGDPAALRGTMDPNMVTGSTLEGAEPVQVPPVTTAPLPPAVAPTAPEPATAADMPAVRNTPQAQPQPQLQSPGHQDYDLGEDEDDGGLFASKGMLVAAGVLAVVILGGGSLMIYQAIFGGGSDGPPPLIQADDNPVRITPDGQATSGNGVIALTENGTPQDGQLRPGAEQPLNLNPTFDPNRQTRIIPINPNDNAQNGGGLGPRPVTTFTVRPDGSIVANGGNTPTTSGSSAVQPRRVTTQPIGQNGQVATTPAIVGREVTSRPLPRPRPGGSAPATTSFGTSTPGVNAPTAAPAGRAALPSTPNVSVAPPASSTGTFGGQTAPSFNSAAPAVQPSTTERVQTQPIPSTTQQVATTAPAQQSAAGGDFVVQVSSQRSEGAALSSYADLQRRFPGVLGAQSPDIVRADLGSRGVFYRVRVGPMQTRDEAAQFCRRLQSAGGDCIVARR